MQPHDLPNSLVYKLMSSATQGSSYAIFGTTTYSLWDVQSGREIYRLTGANVKEYQKLFPLIALLNIANNENQINAEDMGGKQLLVSISATTGYLLYLNNHVQAGTVPFQSKQRNRQPGIMYYTTK